MERSKTRRVPGIGISIMVAAGLLGLAAAVFFSVPYQQVDYYLNRKTGERIAKYFRYGLPLSSEVTESGLRDEYYPKTVPLTAPDRDVYLCRERYRFPWSEDPIDEQFEGEPGSESEQLVIVFDSLFVLFTHGNLPPEKLIQLFEKRIKLWNEWDITSGAHTDALSRIQMENQVISSAEVQ